MSRHTQEPWHFDKYGTPVDANGATISANGFSVVCCAGESQERAKATTRRIVACVNACAGIDSEVLESASEFNAANEEAEWFPPHPIFLMAQENDNLRGQRNELLAALKAYQEAGFGNSTDFTAQRKAHDSAVKAIAKAEGGAS